VRVAIAQRVMLAVCLTCAVRLFGARLPTVSGSALVAAMDALVGGIVRRLALFLAGDRGASGVGVIDHVIEAGRAETAALPGKSAAASNADEKVPAYNQARCCTNSNRLMRGAFAPIATDSPPPRPRPSASEPCVHGTCSVELRVRLAPRCVNAVDASRARGLTSPVLTLCR
jgi:hypothetical protein